MFESSKVAYWKGAAFSRYIAPARGPDLRKADSPQLQLHSLIPTARDYAALSYTADQLGTAEKTKKFHQGSFAVKHFLWRYPNANP